MRTTSTIVAGASCRVTEPLNPAHADPTIHVMAADATITRMKADGHQWWLVVKCDNQAQADYVAAQMKERLDLSQIQAAYGGLAADDLNPVHLIPFRLLGKRWLADWREVEDRIEVREGASGSIYMAVIIDGTGVSDKRLPIGRQLDVPRELANLRGLYPGLYLFDFR